jgi:predicted transcriptional regulator
MTEDTMATGHPEKLTAAEQPRRGGARRGAGRKPVINAERLEELKQLCQIHCTDGEIAQIFGVTPAAVSQWRGVKRIREVMDKARSEGKASLRRLQWKSAIDGNVQMQIHLGKHLLAQTDDVNQHHSGTITLDGSNREELYRRLSGSLGEDAGGTPAPAE